MKTTIKKSIGIFFVIIFIIITQQVQADYNDTTLAETRSGVKTRIISDIDKIKELISSSSLSQTIKNSSLAELDNLKTQANNSNYPSTDVGFRAIIPLNDIHKNVYKIYGQVLATKSNLPLAIWHNYRFDKVDLFTEPQSEVSQLQLKLMKNERRATSLNITNTTEEEKTIDISVSNLPAGAILKVYKGEYVDVKQVNRGPGFYNRDAGPSALIELTGPNYQATIPSGMTGYIFFLLDSKNITSGNYNSNIHISSGTFQKDVGLDIYVSSLMLPNKLDHNLMAWDYIFENKYQITSENKIAAAIDFSDHFGNVPFLRSWGNVTAVPRQKRSDFDNEGNLRSDFDYSSFDAFLDMFPDSNYYAIFFYNFAGEGTNYFAGFRFKTSQWKRAVGSWVKGFSDYMVSKGKDPSQLMLQWYDEPKSNEAMELAIEYAKASETMAPEVTTMVTVNAKAGLSYPDIFTYTDIVNPTISDFTRALSESERNTYRNFATQEGKQLWMYDCGSGWGYSPTHHLQNIWYGFNNNASGFGFWSYGHTINDGGNWNMYYGPNGSNDYNYSPLFIDETSITTSRKWEAIREGMENAQYLTMFKSKIEELEGQGNSSADVVRGRDILDNFKPDWEEGQLMEDRRIEILEILERLDKSDSQSPTPQPTITSQPSPTNEPPKKYNLTNFIKLANNWLKKITNNQELTKEIDLNNDGIINSRDIGIMMSNWE